MSTKSNKTNRFVAAFNALFAKDEPAAVKETPVTIVEYAKPVVTEEEKLQAFLTEEETILLGEDKRHVLVNEAAAKEALQAAKIAAAVAKLKSDSAARVAKAKLLANDAVAKAEKAVLEDLVETQKLADRVANYTAEEQLLVDRMAAIRARRIHDMDIVAAHMDADDSRAEQARQAAILLAGRNTSYSSKGDKSYSSNAGSGGAGDAEKKPAKRPVAFKALKAAGLSTESANEVLDNTYSNKVDEFVAAQIAAGKQAFVAKVAAIMCGDEGAYANRWKAYVGGASTNASGTTASSSTTAPTAGAGIFAAPSQTTTPAAPPKPIVTNGDPVNS